MSALWNKFNLQRPTALTCKVSSQEIDANNFLTKINKVIRDLESQEMLHFEAAVLGRLIYRMKCKFRSDKGLKNMEKTNRALLNYLKLKLEEDYRYLKECVEINNYSNYVVLPTKQMIEYTLVKTQSFAKIMCRIESVSREAAHFLYSRINVGQAWEVSLIAYSVISRIWILSRHLIKKCCDWYKSLYEFTISLKTTGAHWLPKNYNLPFDFKCWLNLPWIDEVLPSILTHEEIKQNIFSLIKHTDDVSENELNFNVEDIPITPKQSASTKKLDTVKKNPILKNEQKKLQEQNLFSFGSTDVGKPISRFAFNSILKKQSQKKKLKNDSRDQESNQDQHKSTKEGERILKGEKELKHETSKQVLNKNERETIKKSEKVLKANKELKHEKSEKSLDKRGKILTADNLKTEKDLILFLQPKSYPGMDKLQWKLLKKNVRQFLVDINKSNESVSKKKKLRMVIKKIKEWTS